MKIVGVIAAKENSNRFKGKNYYMYNGYPLFWHNVKVLLDLEIDVYVVTDSMYIKNYCEERNVKIIWRNDNINKDEQSLFDVIKFAYYSIGQCDIVVNVMANIIGLSSNDIKKAMQIFIDKNLDEVRTYDKSGVENGVMILSKKVFNNKHEISSYVGAVTTKSKEIHYESEITRS